VRSGLVAVAGRPNVGKSTLVNVLAGGKVAIVSDKPQTTRRRISAAVNGELDGEPYQLVLVDLPGFQRPRDPLTARMQRTVDDALEDVDGFLFVLSAIEAIGRGEHPLRRDLAGLLPEGPAYFGEDQRTDLPLEAQLAELVREKALELTREELPHAISVEVDELDLATGRVRALVWVETQSQKAIVVGKGGSMIRAIGTRARPEVEALVGRRVYLDLQVKVRPRWRRDERALERLGI
jgi:GTP-binding protein Era